MASHEGQPPDRGQIHMTDPGLTNRIGRAAYWLKRRDLPYIAVRSMSLLSRYGITPAKAKRRTRECVEFLARRNCQPTFPVPGRVVEKNAAFCRELQAMGAELAVHGYDHVDFSSLSPAEANRQFNLAAEAFRHSGIRFDGFRCPYLSCGNGARTLSSMAMFNYGSNSAISWDVLPRGAADTATPIFDRLNEFYHSESAASRSATPRIVGDLVEIPASLPDDLQLHDGLRLDEQGMKRAWVEILQRTHRRGELFVVMFHPETFQNCALAFDGLLTEARDLRPAVWVTRLAEVGEWWRERALASIEISHFSSGTKLYFDCSDRTTVLVRNIETNEPTHAWDGAYRSLESRTLTLGDDRLPFVGAVANIPDETLSFLKQQGYPVRTGEQAAKCTLPLDGPEVLSLNEVELVEYIERSPAPLVRFWRWPREARSGLCITGDLDALSLMDYASRLLMS